MITVYFLLAAASAGVFLHAGIKFPWFVFFQKDSGLRPKDAPWNMAAAMVFFSALCLLMGIFPEPFYQLLPYTTDYVPYKAGKVLFYLQLLLFSGLAFFLLLPMMKRTLTISLDADWLWRVFLNQIIKKLFVFGGAALGQIVDLVNEWKQTFARVARKYLGVSESGRESGLFIRTWQIGSTALWVAGLLSIYVLVYYVS